jgi:signal transduction histidine kinase
MIDVRCLIFSAVLAIACSKPARTDTPPPPKPEEPAAVAIAEPPPSEKASQIKALVIKAAALVETRGKAAFTDFRVKGSEWFSDDTYLFAYDGDLNVLMNPAFPQREGKNVHGEQDSTGKQFHDEFVKVVKARGEGWVDYLFPKPKTTQPVKKWAYVKGVTIDGAPAIIGAGFYPE